MRTRVLASVLAFLALASSASAQSPPPGFTILSGPGWTQAGGVATPNSTFSHMLWSTAFGPNQQAACTISTVPTAGNTVVINANTVDLNSRVRVVLMAVAGTNNDTIQLLETIGGATTVNVTVNLLRDIAVGDRVGIDINNKVARATYFTQEWNEWRAPITNAITGEPASSFIGVGALNPTACTDFRGQGSLVASDTTPPSVPANCVANGTSQNNVLLVCDPSNDAGGIASYTDRFCEGSGCSNWQTVPGRPSVATSFTVTNLTAGTTYSFQRKATDTSSNESAFTATFEGTTLSGVDTTGPTAPTAVYVQRTGTSFSGLNNVSLQWVAPTDPGGSGVDKIKIERGDANCTNFVQIDVIGNVTTYDDDELLVPLRQGVCYRLRGVDVAGNDGTYSSDTILHPVSGGRFR